MKHFRSQRVCIHTCDLCLRLWIFVFVYQQFLMALSLFVSLSLCFVPTCMSLVLSPLAPTAESQAGWEKKKQLVSPQSIEDVPEEQFNLSWRKIKSPQALYYTLTFPIPTRLRLCSLAHALDFCFYDELLLYFPAAPMFRSRWTCQWQIWASHAHLDLLYAKVESLRACILSV